MSRALTYAPLLQSEGADPSIRSEDFDPYLKPGRHTPVALAVDNPEARAQRVYAPDS